MKSAVGDMPVSDANLKTDAATRRKASIDKIEGSMDQPRKIVSQVEETGLGASSTGGPEVSELMTYYNILQKGGRITRGTIRKEEDPKPSTAQQPSLEKTYSKVSRRSNVA